MLILVTGGGGFVGGKIVQQLRQRGDDVRTFSRGDYPELIELGVDARQGDLADAEAVMQAAKDCDAVIHVAAKAGQWGSYDSFHQPNVVGTENIIKACQAHGIQRLVFTSSPSAIDHGEPIEGGTESIPYPKTFVSHYSKSKALSEQLVLGANDAQLATVALRPPLVWGIGDTRLLPNMLEKAKSGRLIRFGAKENLIDTTYVDNVAQAHLQALDLLTPDAPLAGKAYFLSNDEPRPTFQMIRDLVNSAGYFPRQITIPIGIAHGLVWAMQTAFKLLPTEKEPPMTTFVLKQLIKARWFDISAAKNELGYRPEISIDEGLERLRAHYASLSA